MADEGDAAMARTYGVSVAAIDVLRDALRHGGGRQAQFSHPDLGGMGQWLAGGMVQIGDMRNTELKARVDALCRDLAQATDGGRGSARARAEPVAQQAAWWPAALGHPAAAGAQSGVQYACFPEARRVAIEQAGRVTVYDSGDHRIAGVAQSQGETQDLRFSSQHGTIRVADLPVAE